MQDIKIETPDPIGASIVINDELLTGIMAAYHSQGYRVVKSKDVHKSMLSNGCTWDSNDKAVKIILARRIKALGYGSVKSATGMLFNTAIETPETTSD